jgi:hypothetical protein
VYRQKLYFDWNSARYFRVKQGLEGMHFAIFRGIELR